MNENYTAHIIDLDHSTVFSDNFLETGMLKKSDASVLRQELADEQCFDCLFEEMDDDFYCTSQAALDQHSSYRQGFILAIGPAP